MYGKDPGLPLRAMGFFKDGDLPSLPESDQDVLQKARDRASEIPEVVLTHGSLAGRDVRVARQWFEKAAALGDPEAKRNLRVMRR